VKLAAILWDGSNKIHGKLVLGAEALSFVLSDFANTDLEFEIRYDEISIIDNHSLFGLDERGINKISKSGKSNVFNVAIAIVLKQEIRETMNSIIIQTKAT
jgi:hypothetical protein